MAYDPRPVTINGSLAKSATAITPNDATVFDATIGLYLGVSGDVKLDLSSGSTITMKGLTTGVIHPISCTKVYLTGTTAMEIVGVY